MRKRRRSSSSSSRRSILQHADDETLFAVLLAALSNLQSDKPFSPELSITIQQCLHRFLFILPDSNSPTLPFPIISLIPLLLGSSMCDESRCLCMEIVGAASLFSFEMNEQIAMEGEILNNLVSAVATSKRAVPLAACNAILDLSTTSIGRQQLLEVSALDNLIFRFCQAPRSPATLISLFTEESVVDTCFRIAFMEDEFPILLLHATITLINDCSIEQLEKIPRYLFQNLQAYLKRLWAEVRSKVILGAVQGHKLERCFFLSNIRTNNLAEGLFRLSLQGMLTTPLNFRELKRSIFESGEITFEFFIMKHWEVSPLLITRSSKVHESVFRSFLQLVRNKETVHSLLSSIFQNLTSALSINSDELDIFSFLKEVKQRLGCPIIYQDDVRVVKTQNSKEEMHFFQGPPNNCGSKTPQFLYADDILRFKEAYEEGYTFALRGMEFRFEGIAAIAEGLASLFGQPSTGVNMYLTPPNCQGLTCHRDDHCVLVCQLSGVKRWKVFPQLSHHLPRLYEFVNDVGYVEGESLIVDGSKEYILREGDVLYIPRGFPHEAHAVVDDGQDIGNAEFSLHLTLAIEIEPPFEWQGFAHVALHIWDQNLQLSPLIPARRLSSDLNALSVSLMHIEIQRIGYTNPTFRKACLVGAMSFPLDTECWLDMNQKSVFSHVLNIINTEAKFKDAINSVQAAIRTQEDIFHNLTWIRHLNEGKMSEESYWNDICSIGPEKLNLLVQHEEEAEAAFTEIKSKFCTELVFENIKQCYILLLEKYRKTRKQYLNGMLSLHCN